MYGDVPPLAVKVAAPELPPLQPVLVAATEADNTEGWVIVTDEVAVHELLSVTVTVYVPAALPDIFCVVVPPAHA